MCFGSHPVLGIVPALFSLSPLLTGTPFSVFLSENQLCTTPSMQSSSCCQSYHLQGSSALHPPSLPPLARRASRNAVRLPRSGIWARVETVENQTYWPIRALLKIRTAELFWGTVAWESSAWNPGSLRADRAFQQTWEGELAPALRGRGHHTWPMPERHWTGAGRCQDGSVSICNQ